VRRCCFLTLQERGDFVIDDEVAVPALEAAGWRVDTLPWRQHATPWSAFDLVIVRSTWDYWDDVPGFLEVLSQIDRATRLANPLPLMRWNLSKTYLQDLDAAGVATLPSRWFERLSRSDLVAAVQAFPREDLVLKPQVGGNGQGVLRLPQALPEGPVARALDRYRNRPGMIQPFRPAVTDRGEASLFYFDGALSHAILKRPAPGEFRSQEERGAQIEPLAPSAALRDAGARAMAALPGASLYARIDLIESPGIGAELVELELIEPSLYFRTDADAPGRFAAAVDRWFAASPAPSIR
jgi:glutathione synthase/RimK-type ligase-like ATP-grasp enzyme